MHFFKFLHLTILKAESLPLLLLLLSMSTLLPAEQLLPIAAAATTDSIYSACVFHVALNSAESHLIYILIQSNIEVMGMVRLEMLSWLDYDLLIYAMDTDEH